MNNKMRRTSFLTFIDFVSTSLIPPRSSASEIPVKFYLHFSRDKRLLIIVSELHVGSPEVRLRRSSENFLLWLVGCAVISLAIIVASLWYWGAKEVRGNPGEVLFLTGVGVVWLLVAGTLYSWFGLGIRDDVWERQNSAAAIALACALIATAVVFAAGNLGEGPSYWENIFSAGLATGTLFAFWLAHEWVAHVSVSIAEERDLASGLRFGGVLLAWGLILGRAATGNWHSAAATTGDFIRDGWPAAILCIGALGVELLLKPSRLRPFPCWCTAGFLPAMTYLVLAYLWLRHLGPWEGMPG